MTKKQPTLNEALRELESLVEDLNNDELEIETGLKKFKQGAELIKLCKEKLKTVENEFIELKNDLEHDLDR